MQIPAGLKAKDINGYSDEAQERKDRFHADGKKFLRALAKELGVDGACDISSNKAGIAVSGEVMLHADHLYVQLFDDRDGVRILYRDCKHRKDHTGGQNRYVTIRQMLENSQLKDHFIATCKKLIASHASIPA